MVNQSDNNLGGRKDINSGESKRKEGGSKTLEMFKKWASYNHEKEVKIAEHRKEALEIYDKGKSDLNKKEKGKIDEVKDQEMENMLNELDKIGNEVKSIREGKFKEISSYTEDKEAEKQKELKELQKSIKNLNEKMQKMLKRVIETKGYRQGDLAGKVAKRAFATAEDWKTKSKGDTVRKQFKEVLANVIALNNDIDEQLKKEPDTTLNNEGVKNTENLDEFQKENMINGISYKEEIIKETNITLTKFKPDEQKIKLTEPITFTTFNKGTTSASNSTDTSWINPTRLESTKLIYESNTHVSEIKEDTNG